MHKPSAWVVGFEGDDYETVLREQDHVTARWVDDLQINILRIEFALCLLENGKIVAMQVNLTAC